MRLNFKKKKKFKKWTKHESDKEIIKQFVN